jgi:succinate-semialdehyde dehydrogenase/glutarate-semialdehyde dehydrogenase
MTEAEVLASVHKELLIGGVWRPAESGASIAVEDPATGETLGAADLGHPPSERGEILRRAFERDRRIPRGQVHRARAIRG